MNDNKLFSIEQYGFRTGHSTELAALHLVNDLTLSTVNTCELIIPL